MLDIPRKANLDEGGCRDREHAKKVARARQFASGDLAVRYMRAAQLGCGCGRAALGVPIYTGGPCCVPKPVLLPTCAQWLGSRACHAQCYLRERNNTVRAHAPARPQQPRARLSKRTHEHIHEAYRVNNPPDAVRSRGSVPEFLWCPPQSPAVRQRAAPTKNLHVGLRRQVLLAHQATRRLFC